MTTCTVSPLLAENVGTGCGENAYKCYQCKRCTSGCPVARYADMHPAMIMRAVQLGQLDMVFDDRFIWLCTGCETCTTRCPQGIDIAAIMDELKIIARARRPHPGRHAVGGHAQAQLRLVRALGPHVGGRAHHARRAQAAEQREVRGSRSAPR